MYLKRTIWVYNFKINRMTRNFIARQIPLIYSMNYLSISNETSCNPIHFNPFSTNAPLLYPLKTSEHCLEMS